MEDTLQINKDKLIEVGKSKSIDKHYKPIVTIRICKTRYLQNIKTIIGIGIISNIIIFNYN